MGDLARVRGSGSPPPFSILLILATAYGRGPLGVDGEDISPTDLVSEAYERLAPEDLLALRRFADIRRDHPPRPAEADTTSHQHSGAQQSVGPDFNLIVPTLEHDNPEICAFSLPNPQPGQLLDLSWDVFGLGIARLMRQIKSLGRRLQRSSRPLSSLAAPSGT